MVGPSIPFRRMISQSSVEGLLEEVRGYTAPPAVTIASPGGTFEFFNELGPAIENRGLTMVADYIHGSAFTLMLLGARRLAYPDSTLGFCEVGALVTDGSSLSIATAGEIQMYAELMEDEMEQGMYLAWVKRMQDAQAWLLRFIEQRIRIPASRVAELMKGNITLNAHEAVQYGFVHEIVPRGMFAEASLFN